MNEKAKETVKPTVKLSDVAEHVEMASDDTTTFYNELTGEFYWDADFLDDDYSDVIHTGLEAKPSPVVENQQPQCC